MEILKTITWLIVCIGVGYFTSVFFDKQLGQYQCLFLSIIIVLILWLIIFK